MENFSEMRISGAVGQPGATMNRSSSQSDLESLSRLWLTRALQQPQLVAAALVLLVVFLYSSKQKDRRRLPPGPRPWPIIGNLGLLSLLAHQDFEKMAKKYGPIFYLRLGSKDAFVISSPTIAEEILKKHDVAFASRKQTSFIKFFFYNGETPATTPYGPFWIQARKVFALELLTRQRIQQFRKLNREELMRAVISMIDVCKDQKTACLPDLKLKDVLINTITRMMMPKTYLGSNSSARTEKTKGLRVESSFKELFALSAVFNIGDYIPILKRLDLQGIEKRMRVSAKQNDKFLQWIVDAHRKKLGAKEQDEEMDLVDVLLSRRTGIEEKPLTDNQIKGILLNMALAGAGTSRETVTWAMTQLLKHPHVLKKAQDELDAVVGRDRLVEESDIPNLKYFRLIIKETFRLHPPAPFLIPHECAESREVAGYHIPAKSQVFVNVYAIQRDPQVWERPLDFDPDRFLSTSIDVHGQDFELLPFGAGRRGCPGKNLALVLVDSMLSVLLHSCDWSLPAGMTPEELDLSEAPGAIVAKKIALEAIATPRLPMDVICGEGKTPPEF